MKNSSSNSLCPEWQHATIGWKKFVSSRPDLGLKDTEHASAWFIRHHKDRLIEQGILKRINKAYYVDVTRFPKAAFDAMLGI